MNILPTRQAVGRPIDSRRTRSRKRPSPRELSANTTFNFGKRYSTREKRKFASTAIELTERTTPLKAAATAGENPRRGAAESWETLPSENRAAHRAPRRCPKRIISRLVDMRHGAQLHRRRRINHSLVALGHGPPDLRDRSLHRPDGHDTLGHETRTHARPFVNQPVVVGLHASQL